jgi:hypothetical protein
MSALYRIPGLLQDDISSVDASDFLCIPTQLECYLRLRFSSSQVKVLPLCWNSCRGTVSAF